VRACVRACVCVCVCAQACISVTQHTCTHVVRLRCCRGFKGQSVRLGARAPPCSSSMGVTLYPPPPPCPLVWIKRLATSIRRLWPQWLPNGPLVNGSRLPPGWVSKLLWGNGPRLTGALRRSTRLHPLPAARLYLRVPHVQLHAERGKVRSVGHHAPCVLSWQARMVHDTVMLSSRPCLCKPRMHARCPLPTAATCRAQASGSVSSGPPCPPLPGMRGARARAACPKSCTR